MNFFWLYFLIPQSCLIFPVDIKLMDPTSLRGKGVYALPVSNAGKRMMAPWQCWCMQGIRWGMTPLETWEEKNRRPVAHDEGHSKAYSAFLNLAVWWKKGRLLEMKTRTQRTVTWPWADGRLLGYGSWLLSHLYTSRFHSLATLSEDPAGHKSHGSQEELRGWWLLPARLPGALVCVHKHPWQEIKVFTMIVS